MPNERFVEEAMRTLAWLAGALVAVLLLLWGGMLLLAEYGGEVVDLRTTDASGATFETRLWVVDDSGFTWLWAAAPGRRWLERFGMTYYGCCEPLHKKIHILISIPNLRKISISHWADINEAARQISNDYVISLKPDTAIFAIDNWNPERAREELETPDCRDNACNSCGLEDTEICKAKI